MSPSPRPSRIIPGPAVDKLLRVSPGIEEKLWDLRSFLRSRWLLVDDLGADPALPSAFR